MILCMLYVCSIGVVISLVPFVEQHVLPAQKMIL